MSEQQRPPAREPDAPPGLAAVSSSDPLATDLFSGNLPEPSDDTPTIISRAPPHAVNEDGLLAGLLRGRMLAHFELIEAIGVGGMAAVLRARDTQLDRPVALKILPPEMAADPENVRRFHQEARAAARLDHETIARVFFCGEDQGLHFIAFEYVEGDNLRTLLDRRGPLPVEEALHYMLQIATGLAHAAERGVVHRDIKPSNIIVSPNGRAKLVDMGLARSLGPQHDNGLTQSGVTLGTFDYISPEQALEPRDADTRSDIYSLGCTFYHLLTGQAPVPEGTAARKLHHHQHVLPIDPRELNPDIPDDVALVLGRMMAKDPRQRYQRPEELVEHLVQVTQRLNSGTERTDGVLLMETPWSAAPRTRPFLVAGLAVFIVIVLVFFVRTPPRPSPGEPPGPAVQSNGSPTSRPGEEAPRPVGPIPAVGPDLPATVTNPPTETQIRVTSWAQLREQARQLPSDRELDLLTVTVAGDLTAPERGGEGPIVLHARRIALIGEEKDGRRPVLWLQATDAEPWPGLVLRADDRIEIQRLRFVLDAGIGRPRLAGVMLRGATAAVVRECEFVQVAGPAPADAAERFTSLAVRSGGRAPTALSLTACAFVGAGGFEGGGLMMMGTSAVPHLKEIAEGGHDAVSLHGSVTVTAEGCAFGPHAALFHFRERGRKGTLALTHCAALVGEEWALAHVDEATACDSVKAERCLFARTLASPDRGMFLSSRLACLVRHGDRSAEGTAYIGEQSRYFQLDAVRLGTDDEGAVGPDTFAGQLGTSEPSPILSQRPWKEKDPLGLLQQALELRDLRPAFAADLERPTLARELALEPTHDRVAGLHKLSPWGPLYEGLALPPRGLPAAGAGPRRLIVDQTRETGGGVYKKLGSALGDAQAGDEILLRHNGVLKVSSVALKVGVTLKADDGFRPVLVLDDGTDLFHVRDGQLTLEGLEVRLTPPAGASEPMSVVRLQRDGGIEFRRCVLTLDGPARALSAVSLPDAPDGMPPPRDGAGPRVTFRNCFIRGEGDLVTSRTNHPFQLTVNDTLAALTGSLLTIDNAEEKTPFSPGKRVQVALDHVTAYLGGHLVRLRCGDLRHLVPVEVTRAASSLFASSGDGARASLIHLEGPSAAADKLKEKVVWKAGEQNYFSQAFGSMVDQPPRGENEMSSEGVSWEGWRGFANEVNSKNGPVKFTGPLPPLAPATSVTLSAFRVESGGPQNVGARLTELPEPSEP